MREKGEAGIMSFGASEADQEPNVHNSDLTTFFN
jgi:hypothetical protein